MLKSILLLFLIITPITALAEEHEIRCKALIEFCPSCDYKKMITSIKEWQYPSSLNDYLININPIRQEVEELLETNGVSRFYLYLALAESGGVVDNLSEKNARGLWQLMPYISRHYGLTINNKVDERLNYRKATEAAARYIQRNLKAFDNNALWCIAAYNAGGTNLKRLTGYTKGMPFSVVKQKSYRSYALAITVIKMIYTAEC